MLVFPQALLNVIVESDICEVNDASSVFGFAFDMSSQLGFAWVVMW